VGQEDTRDVGPVAPVDIRAKRVDILLLSVPLHHLRGFPDCYIHSSRGHSRWDSQGRQEDSTDRGRRTARTRAGSATGPIQRVQDRLFGIGTKVPCRHELARLLFDQISK
jgi:hypothetical protein